MSFLLLVPFGLRRELGVVAVPLSFVVLLVLFWAFSLLCVPVVVCFPVVLGIAFSCCSGVVLWSPSWVSWGLFSAYPGGFCSVV